GREQETGAEETGGQEERQTRREGQGRGIITPAHLREASQFGKLHSYTFNGGTWELKRLLFLFVAVIVFSAVGLMSGAAQNDNPSKDARAAVNQFFLLLKSRSYPALYEFLPSDLQRQVTREQLALSLMRLDSFITIERMEVGRVQAHGDFAVINTTIYGRLKKPVTLN